MIEIMKIMRSMKNIITTPKRLEIANARAPRLISRRMKLLANTFFLALIQHASAAAGVYLQPFEHHHLSEGGTPFVHSFGIEPASTGRDLFLDHSYREGNGVTEHESEMELEWAFTRRLGIIMELPYIWEDEEGVATASGLGDVAIVPRALLVESERFLLTAQTELLMPSGSSGFGGETAIAPAIVMWNDLGDWWTLNTSISIEHGFDEDSTELIYGFGLVKSFGKKCEDHDHHDHHQHHVTNLLNFHLEATGTTPINGADQGDVTIEGLIGISYGISQGFDIRAGYMFPITSPAEFDKGFTAGIICHF